MDYRKERVYLDADPQFLPLNRLVVKYQIVLARAGQPVGVA